MYTWSLKKKNNIKFFENLAVIRLKELKRILSEFEIAADMIDQIKDFAIHSTLILDLVDMANTGNGLTQTQNINKTPNIR